MRQNLRWALFFFKVLIYFSFSLKNGGGYKLLIFFLCAAFITHIYNSPKWNLRKRPGLDLIFGSIGYLLLLPLSSWLNGNKTIYFGTFLFHFFNFEFYYFCFSF